MTGAYHSLRSLKQVKALLLLPKRDANPPQVEQSPEPIYTQRLVSQESRNFSGLIRVPQFFYIFATARSSKPSNFASLLVFLASKTCEKISFSNKQITVSQLAFRARKIPRTFEKTGPRVEREPGREVSSPRKQRHAMAADRKVVIGAKMVRWLAFDPWRPGSILDSTLYVDWVGKHNDDDDDNDDQARSLSLCADTQAPSADTQAPSLCGYTSGYTSSKLMRGYNTTSPLICLKYPQNENFSKAAQWSNSMLKLTTPRCFYLLDKERVYGCSRSCIKGLCQL